MMSEYIGLRKVAAQLRDDFNAAATKLDTHAKNVNISRVTGGSFGVAGGIIALIGFFLAPVTGGITLAVGASVAAAGGLTAGGASVVKAVVEKDKIEKVIDRWDVFIKCLTAVLEKNNPGENLHASFAGGVGAAGTAMSLRVVGGIAARVTTTASRSTARLLVMAATGFVILNGVLIVQSLYDIVDGSAELHKREGSKGGDYLRLLASSLDDFARDGLGRTFCRGPSASK